MIQTVDIKDELSCVPVASAGIRRAELAAFLRFTGGLVVEAGRIAVVAQTDQASAAQRFRAAICELYGCNVLVESGGSGKKTWHVLQVIDDAVGFARQTGLVDPHGRSVRGLPTQIIGGTVVDNEAAWRGAFLAAGTMLAPGRSTTLEVACPCFEAAMALVGAARRLGISAKARQARGGDLVVVRENRAITTLLVRMGAKHSQTVWNDQRSTPAAAGPGHPSWSFGGENQHRAAHAAYIAAMRVQRALQILDGQVPGHLAQAARLRINYPDASLHALAQLADPPSTKDAIAGRIRRLLQLSDQTANHHGIPDTHAALPAESSHR